MQRTLGGTCSFEGKGLHTGALTRVLLRPAAPDTGIVFVRTDSGVEIPATADRVHSTLRSTRLGRGRSGVATVEHLLSALTGMGIDNARIEMDGFELPILDGSAGPYAAAIASVGAIGQDVPRRWLELDREIIVRNPRSGSWIRVTPAERTSVEMSIDYGSRVLKASSVSFDFDTDYASEIAPCRTFCFLHELMPQLLLGLAKGGDLDNAIIVAERPVSPRKLAFMARMMGKEHLGITPEGYLDNLSLRFPDECARHKMLDLLGDLRLCGGFLRARVEAHKPGHALNTAAAAEIMKSVIKK